MRKFNINKIVAIIFTTLMVLSVFTIINLPIASAQAPTITVSPTSGPPGTTVTVTGSGFIPSETVQIYFDTTYIKEVQADSNGDFETTITVPSDATYGEHTIRAIGLSSGSTVESPFYVTEISVSPTSGHVGDTVTINGYGFENYTRVYYDGELKAIAPVDSAGHFVTAFAIPNSTNGAHSIKAVQSSNGTLEGENPDWYAEATFTVLPNIVLSPTSGPPGAPVSISGTGFSASADVTVYFDKNNNGVRDPDEKVATTATDTAGFFSTTFTVPDVPYGTYTVWANDTEGVEASATFTVSPSIITIEPRSGIVGATVRISGSSFTPGATISVTLNETPVNWYPTGQAPTVEADGTFSGIFIVPMLEPGTYVVNATDDITWATETFTIPEPSITLNITSGPVGIPVMITGSNFANGTIYNIRVFILNETLTPVDITEVTEREVTSEGSIMANITIPLEVGYPAPGIYTIMVNASEDATIYKEVYATATFEVLASSIVLERLSGVTGEWIRITGENFYPGDTITFKMDTEPLSTVPSTVKADSSGRFSALIQIPTTLAPGIYTISAVGSRGHVGFANYAEAPFEIKSFERLILDELRAIESKLDVGGTFYNFVEGWFESISSTLNEVKAKTDAINWNDITLIYNVVSYISGKLGIFSGSDTVASLLYEIKSTLNNVNASIMNKLNVIEGVMINVNSTLDDVKSELINMNATIIDIKDEVNSVIDHLLNSEYGLPALSSAISNVSEELNTLQNNVTNLSTKVDEILSELTSTEYGLQIIKSTLDDVKSELINMNATIIDIKDEVMMLSDNVDDILNILGNMQSTILSELDEIKDKITFDVMGELFNIENKLSTLENTVQFKAGEWSETIPTQNDPVNLGKSAKVTLTVSVKDDSRSGFEIKVYIWNGDSWQVLRFRGLPGYIGGDAAATVEFTTGPDGRFYFEVFGADFQGFIYSAEYAP